VFTTPTPQSIWSTREQSPPRMFTKKVGTMKPGWSQQPCVPRPEQPFGLPQHPGQTAPGQPVVALLSSVVQLIPLRDPELQRWPQHPGHVAPGQPVVVLVLSVVQLNPRRDPAIHCLTSHPGTPAQGACGFPHGTQALCSQVGKLPGVTVKFVCTPVGNGITCPSAVTHGSWRHPPAVLPQSASVLHVLKRVATQQPGQVAPGQPVVALVSSVVQLMPLRVPPLQALAEVVVHRFSPVVPLSR